MAELYHGLYNTTPADVAAALNFESSEASGTPSLSASSGYAASYSDNPFCRARLMVYPIRPWRPSLRPL